MSEECEVCGEEFDTERGLHVHESQKHDVEKKENNSEVEKSENSGEANNDSWSFEIPKPSFSGTKGLVIVLLIGLIFGFGAGYVSPDLTSLLPEEEPKVNLTLINNSDDPVLGADDAPVTMVIYEDFQCPFCKRYEDVTVNRVESEYVDSGQVKIVWKDFPIRRRHPQAQITSEVMECVQRQNQTVFWSLKDEIFSEYSSLYPRSQRGYDTTEDEVQEKVIQWAADEGLKKETIRSCLRNGNPEEAVQEDLDEGRSFNTTIGGRSFVGGTPGTVIYAEGDVFGTPIVGAQPFSAVSKTIEEKLDN